MAAKEGEIVSLTGLHLVVLSAVALALTSGYSLGRMVQGEEDLRTANKQAEPRKIPYTPSNCLWLDDKASP